MITTHVLDLARGVPGAGVSVTLEILQEGEWDWVAIARGQTDRNGRLTTLTQEWKMVPGTYRLTFDIGTYHRDCGIEAPFFPHAHITFTVRNADEHFHVPLLVSPYGYSTYRGS
jgi:hydroxyisourate hydrolase